MRSTTTVNTTHPTGPEDRGLMDCGQAAKYLNLSESYIRKAVAGRRIPFVRIGTRTVFRRADLDQWISERVVRTGVEVTDQAETIAATVRLRTRRVGRRSA